MPKKKTKQNKKPLVCWKSGKGWVIFNPPKSHPSYDEWQKVKPKDGALVNYVNWRKTNEHIYS